MKEPTGQPKPTAGIAQRSLSQRVLDAPSVGDDAVLLSRAPMPDRAALLSFAQTAAPYLTAQRIWLERLALIIPGPVATRWLLIADAVCLTAIGLASSRPRIWVPMALAVGFVGVNVAGMVLTDFYLGLAVFHLAAGSAAIVFARRWRWVGLTALCLTLALGILT